MATWLWPALMALVVGSSCKPWHLRPCLSGDDKRARFVRRGWHDATEDSADWHKRICATERVITRHHGGDAPDAPACVAEILERFTGELLDDRPVPYDRLQLARLVGVTRTSQTTTFMTAKGAVLIRLAALREEDIADYRMISGETGPPLPKRAFRHLALQGLANTHLAMNRKEVLNAALARRRQATDAMERRILYPIVALHFENALWGHPRRGEDNGSFALFDRLLAETQAAIEQPYDELEHGLILDHIALLSFHAKRFGREQATLDWLRNVLARAALVPAVEGQPTARRDLYVAAALAEAECQLDHDRVRSSVGRFYEQPPKGVDELLRNPVLYQRGIDCRGRRAEDLQLPKLLRRHERGELTITSSSDQALTKEAKRLLNMLAARPHEVTASPKVRTLLLTHPEVLQKRARTVWYWHDPLVPLQLALSTSAPDDQLARALVQGIFAQVAALQYPWRLTRELFMAARQAPRFGLQDEASALADTLAERAAQSGSPDALVVVVAGLRASLAAAGWSAASGSQDEG